MLNNNRTNCPNCGAALEWGKPSCEFCGTRIVDLTMLDFDAQTPTAFMLRMPHSQLPKEYKDMNVYVSMLAKPELQTVVMHSDTVSVYGGYGLAPIAQYNANSEVQFQVSLNSYVPKGEKEICRITAVKKEC